MLRRASSLLYRRSNIRHSVPKSSVSVLKPKASSNNWVKSSVVGISVAAFISTASLTTQCDAPNTTSGELDQVLFPPIEPYTSGRLQVSKTHNLYYEECGNKNGKVRSFLIFILL